MSTRSVSEQLCAKYGCEKMSIRSGSEFAPDKFFDEIWRVTGWMSAEC